MADEMNLNGPPSRTLYSSAIVQVGDFRCPIAHPRFSATGACNAYCFVFPRAPVWIEHDGSAAFVADSTTVPLYNAGHPYKRSSISPEGDRTDWFAANPSLLREMIAEFNGAAADHEHRLFEFDFVRSEPSIFVAQRQVFNHIVHEATPDALFIEETVINILGSVLERAYGQTRLESATSARQRNLVEGVKSRLGQTFGEQESIAAIADALDSSIFHMCRVFRRTTGLTIHKYRHQLRLRRALDLLDGEQQDILAAAVDLGYSGHSHFTKAFHDNFGLTPSEYRRLSRARRRLVTADQLG
jgi:AraC-like DNA-binding protein